MATEFVVPDDERGLFEEQVPLLKKAAAETYEQFRDSGSYGEYRGLNEVQKRFIKKCSPGLILFLITEYEKSKEWLNEQTTV